MTDSNSFKPKISVDLLSGDDNFIKAKVKRNSGGKNNIQVDQLLLDVPQETMRDK